MKQAKSERLEELENERACLGRLWEQVIQYESVPARRQALESACWEPGVPVVPDDLNQHPLLLNVENGTLDLESLELRPHRREDLLTQIAPVRFDPKATCAIFQAFLLEIIPAVEVRNFIRRVFGYSLTGLVLEHILVFLHGPGKNGKTTLLNALMETLGDDYAMPAPPKLLVKRSHDEHLTEIASLFGKRLVVCSESGEGARLDEEKVKRLTGGDRLSARRMREDPWTFAPSHTLWLYSNYEPKIQGTDDGIWRRVLLIPFFATPRKVDKELGKKLRAERAGILNWGLEGLRDYLESGLAPPESVKSATDRYRSEQDVVGRFISECIASGPGQRVAGRAMFEAIKRWCESNGEDCPTNTSFGKEVVKRGLTKITSNGVWYLDVRLVR